MSGVIPLLLDLNERGKGYGGKLYLHAGAYAYGSFIKEHLGLKMLPYSLCNLDDGAVHLGVHNKEQLLTVVNGQNSKKPG
jgi:hypothetical protein